MAERKELLLTAVVCAGEQETDPEVLRQHAVPETAEGMEVLVFPGTAAALQQGIREAAGRYLLVLQPGDRMTEGSAAALMEELSDCAEDAVIFENVSGYSLLGTPVEHHKTYRFDDIAEGLEADLPNLALRTGLLRERDISVAADSSDPAEELLIRTAEHTETVRFTGLAVIAPGEDPSTSEEARQAMIREKAARDRLLAELLPVYDRTKEPHPARGYLMARHLAGIVSCRIRTGLYEGPKSGAKQEIMALDRQLKKEYPAVYYSNRNSAVELLRKSAYLMFGRLSRIAGER